MYLYVYIWSTGRQQNDDSFYVGGTVHVSACIPDTYGQIVLKMFLSAQNAETDDVFSKDSFVQCVLEFSAEI